MIRRTRPTLQVTLNPGPDPAAEAALPSSQTAGSSGSTERLVLSEAAGPALLEQFRGFAATLERVQREQKVRSLIVTSPSPGDGKSHVAVNLALTLADSYRRRVLLIDGDLRRPTLHLLFGVDGSRGLGDALKADNDESLAELQVHERLTLLPAGVPEMNPVGDLSSGRLSRLITEAESRFDWVIVDSPPAVGLADARIISETVDTILLVVRAGVTRFPDLEAAVETLGHDRVLGVVLNAVDPGELHSEHYYSYYYRDRKGQKS
jgi:capsular exopolysaccharide synthesis family protein